MQAQNRISQEADSVSSRPKIKWIGQIPTIENTNKINNFTKRFIQFFTGRKTLSSDLGAVYLELLPFFFGPWQSEPK